MFRVARLLQDERGFTLMELTFVIIILAILVLLVIGTYEASTTLAEKVTCESNLRSIRAAVAMYHSSNDSYPDALDDLSPSYVTGRGLRCPTTEAPYSYDASTGRVTCSVHNF